VEKDYSNFLIQLCCHSELYASTKVLIKNCKTLDEVQQVMLDFNNKQLLQAEDWFNATYTPSDENEYEELIPLFPLIAEWSVYQNKKQFFDN
jgi:hypothetical protein